MMFLIGNRPAITAILAATVLSTATRAQMPNDEFLSSTAEPIPAIPTSQDEVMAMVKSVADNYEAASLPGSEIWKHLPTAPDNYPDALKGILWMDQYGYYGLADLPRQANENLLSFGTDLSTLDQENKMLWHAGSCGDAWTISEDFNPAKPKNGTWYHKNYCTGTPGIFQFTFNEDYTAAQFHQFKEGILQGPQALGYRGALALVPPQQEGVCPPPPEATKGERNLCAKWIRTSYGVDMETGVESDAPPSIYPVFEVVGADGQPKEPYYTAFLDSLVHYNATTQLYRKLVEGPDSITITDINHDLDEEDSTSEAEDAPVGMPNDSFLASTAEPIPAVPFPQDEVLALQQVVADDYESVAMPGSEIWKHLPMPPDDYPDSLKGILWMDQYGHYGYQNLTGQANENMLTFGDLHLPPLDKENQVLWTGGGCGGAWTIDEKDFAGVTGTVFHEQFCAVTPALFQFAFNEDYTAAQFHQFKNGTLQGPEAQGYRGTMALVPPQEDGVCPPPPEATKQERNLCAKWIRASYGVDKETGIQTGFPPYIYPVFEVVGADGKPREPYFSAMLDWLEVKNTTTQLYRKLVNLGEGETVITAETLTQEKPVVTVTDIDTGEDADASGDAPGSDDKTAPESGGICPKFWTVAFMFFCLTMLG